MEIYCVETWSELLGLLCIDISEISYHDLHHLGEVDVVLPAPLLPRQLVVEDHGPAVGYLLPGVRTVGDPQVWHPLLHLLEYLLWGKADSVDIEGPGGESLPGGHHVLDGPPQTVVDVHHGQPGVGPQVALVLLAGQSVVKYLDSVVRGAPARVRVVGNNSRKSEGCPGYIYLNILPTSNI